MDADSLYQERILALARLARSKPRLDAPDHTGEARNPVCGDRIIVDFTTGADGVIADMGTRIDGCALCEASAGLMVERIEGRLPSDTLGLHEAIARWLVDEQTEMVVEGQDAFTPVKGFPSRHRCITLPFEALAKAVEAD